MVLSLEFIGNEYYVLHFWGLINGLVAKQPDDGFHCERGVGSVMKISP